MNDPSERDRHHNDPASEELTRRQFLQTSAAVGAGLAAAANAGGNAASASPVMTFSSPDSLYHGHQWQTLNPGYWQIKNGALRRRLVNYGDRARRTGFPFHAETHQFEYRTNYDPSLESGILYASAWDLKENYSLKVEFTFRGDRPEPKHGDDPGWKMYREGFGLMGVAIGGKSIYESYGRIINALRIGWTDDNKLQILGAAKGKKGRQSGNEDPADEVVQSADAMPLTEGDACQLIVKVSTNGPSATIHVTLSSGGKSVSLNHTLPKNKVAGYVGVASRGLIDFEVNRFEVDQPPGG